MAKSKYKTKSTMQVSTGGGAAMKYFGVPEMRKALGAYAKALGPESMGELRDEIKDILMIPARTVRDEAKDYVPVVTGTLRDSIIAAKGPADKPGVVVFVDVKTAWYGAIVERGASKHVAHPFMRPAITAVKGQIAAMIAGPLEKLLQRIAADNAFTPHVNASEGKRKGLV